MLSCENLTFRFPEISETDYVNSLFLSLFHSPTVGLSSHGVVRLFSHSRNANAAAGLSSHDVVVLFSQGTVCSCHGGAV